MGLFDGPKAKIQAGKDKYESAKDTANSMRGKGGKCEGCGSSVRTGFNLCQGCLTGKKLPKDVKIDERKLNKDEKQALRHLRAKRKGK